MSELFDPGLQPERTDLAWRRTGLGFLANAALMARFAHETSLDLAAYGLAVLFALTGAVTLARTRHLYDRRGAGLRAGVPAARPDLLRALWSATTVLCVAALVLVALA